MSHSYAREFDALRRVAGETFGRQRDVLESALHILADTARQAGKSAVAHSPIAPRKKSGLGGFVLAGFAVALVAGAAYVAWQTLRTDDEAWIDDDFDID